MHEGLTFNFKGRLADRHVLSVELLGRSLSGLDRLANSGLVFFEFGRMPKQRERSSVHLVTKPPAVGTVDLATFVANVPFLLPIAKESITSGGSSLLLHFMGYAFSKFGGRKSDAETYMRSLENIVKTDRDFILQSQSQWQSTLLSLVDKLLPQVRSAVSPIGRDASILAITDRGSGNAVVVDEPIADAIRSVDDVEISDEYPLDIAVDGVIHHSKQLKIVHPDDPSRYITAEVRDPLFDIAPSVYSDAAASKRNISVRVKAMRKGGELQRFYIMGLA